MSAEVRFQEIIRQVQNLLDCGASGLLLGCAEPELRHPLLNLLPATCYPKWYGSPELVSLLSKERICALCDLAIQIGQIQCINSLAENMHNLPIYSLAIAPLERPAGLLGLLLLTSPLPAAFQQNEIHLLRTYIQTAAQALEQNLRQSFSDIGCLNTKNTTSVEVVNNSPDISQQKELDILKNEFVSMVSHELRSPLSAIKGYAGLLQAYSIPDQFSESMEAITTARQQQYLDIIMEQANHLEVLISDLLDVSRIQAGRLALHFTAVDVGILCRQVTQVAQSRVDQQQPQKYNLQCIVAPDLPHVWADPDRVQQVLSNLLENAIKYSPDGGQIEVIASLQHTNSASNGYSSSNGKSAQDLPAPPDSGRIQITVRDQGIGISYSQQIHLFKPFTRLEQAVNGQIAGTGLGLYLSRKLIEAMGGAVTLHSCEGQGTSVTFTLPLAADEPLENATSIALPSNHLLGAATL